MKKNQRNRVEPQKDRQSFATVVRLFICIAVAGFMLFAYIDKQNELIELRLVIPVLAKEVKEIHEQNTRLLYQIEQFESPILLMEVMRKPEYSHLRYPYLNEEIILRKGLPLLQN